MSGRLEQPADGRTEHDRAAELLPWLVNGTLPAEERTRLERHVQSCLPCRAALRTEQRLAQLVRRQPTVPLSADEGFERLRERMAAPAPRTPARVAPWLLATAAALALAAWLAVDVARPPSPEFTTLTAAAAGGTRIDLVFAEDAAESDVRAVVRELGGTIVAGPNQVGRYTVALERPGELDALLARLQRDPRVRLAARSFDAGQAP